MKKTVVLVDGQNLYYALKSLGIKENEINWKKLFQSLLEPNDDYIRAYWFRPQKIRDEHYTAQAIRNKIVFSNYRESFKAYRSPKREQLNPKILETIENDAKKVEQWLQNERKKFYAAEYRYDQICLDNNDIQIVKKGLVKVNPFKREYTGEKGVDIALAVKMISLSVERRCDKVILISGDYDYAEAINYVKDTLTKVHIVKIHKGFPPKNTNMSRDLSVMADKIINLYEADIRANFLT